MSFLDRSETSCNTKAVIALNAKALPEIVQESATFSVRVELITWKYQFSRKADSGSMQYNKIKHFFDCDELWANTADLERESTSKKTHWWTGKKGTRLNKEGLRGEWICCFVGERSFGSFHIQEREQQWPRRAKGCSWVFVLKTNTSFSFRKMGKGYSYWFYWSLWRLWGIQSKPTAGSGRYKGRKRVKWASRGMFWKSLFLCYLIAEFFWPPCSCSSV